MTITTRLYTYFNGTLVGSDPFGNRYFQEKRKPRGRRRKRWVLYNGLSEPSKVPPEWHGWLHYTSDTPPTKQHRQHYAWEKPHMPNLTGTAGAYLPPGHLQKSGTHAPTIGAYEPWQP
jgi:NADH:ubiquinone oxidoreductase subunit